MSVSDVRDLRVPDYTLRWQNRLYRAAASGGVILLDAFSCNADSGLDAVCTRMAGHTGRHSAAGSEGYIFEVWPADDNEED